MFKAPRYITDQIKVEKFIPGGQALGTLPSGKKIFLWGALPGEIVARTKVTKEKSSYVEGVAEKVIQKSQYRIEPEDDCYLATSPWQILDYEYEKSQKEEILREIFRQHNIVIPAELQDFRIASFDPYHYRNKMEYALYFSHEDQKIHLAFHERGSHRKIPVTKSSLEYPEIWERAQEIVDELNAKGEDARKYQSLLLRAGQSLEPKGIPRGLPINPELEVVVSGGLYENGQPHPKFPALYDVLLENEFAYSPNGFFQINIQAYSRMLVEVDLLNLMTEKVLDLYSGVGTIGLSLARNRDLTLVECDKNAYQEMVRNVESVQSQAQEPGTKLNIKPVLAKSEDVLEYVEHDQTVIVDPPRAGCMPEVIDRFLEVEPQQIIYLSCNTATQARDVKRLLEKYEMRLFLPYNFFPRTPHIENLILLQRKGSKTPINLQKYIMELRYGAQ